MCYKYTPHNKTRKLNFVLYRFGTLEINVVATGLEIPGRRLTVSMRGREVLPALVRQQGNNEIT